MRRSQIIAIIICIFSGSLLAGMVVTRNAMRRHSDTNNQTIDQRHPFAVNYNQLRVIDPFELTERSEQTFRSTTLDGQVYVASFFFASCPVICREQNQYIADVIRELDDDRVRFVSISVDPEDDTPLVLREYARKFGADEMTWDFLTGDLEKTRAIGDNFAVNVGVETHGSSLMLVDKWGRFRDRFSIDSKEDRTRMFEVIHDVLEEMEAPFGAEIETRAIPRANSEKDTADITYGHGDRNVEGEWIDHFVLTERSGRRVDSRLLTGKPYVASFFFSKCPTICGKQNETIAQFANQCKEQELDTRFVSISCDSEYDTPLILRSYAAQFDAEEFDWLFLTGEQFHIERIAAEMFLMSIGKEKHPDSILVLIDQWGNHRGKFHWDDPISMTKLQLKLEAVLSETDEPEESILKRDKFGPLDLPPETN